MNKLVTKDLYWVGALDPELRVFDIVMYTDYGTTYNSYILKTEKGAILFETVKEKFFDSFIKNIEEVCPIDNIKYVVVDHTEPDHAGSLKKLLQLNPNITVVSSPTANTFLKDIINIEFNSYQVADNDTLQLGDYKLKFLSVPFLHWPDSIYTYISKINTLITCDSFGCHYSDEKIFNDKIEGDFTPAYKYYFDMIMGPFKKHVQYALKRIEEYKIDNICPGHGPVLRENLEHYINLYDKWSKQEQKEKGDKPNIIIAYVSAYGYTQKLANKIIEGINSGIDANIELVDMVGADEKEVLNKIKNSDGFLLGTPTINGDALPPIYNLASSLNGVVDGGKVAGVFGSYGWSGEGPDIILERLRLCRMNIIEPAYKVKFNPENEKLDGAFKFGEKFAKKLFKDWVKIGGEGEKTYWKCLVCGEIFEGALPPETCSVCGAGQEAFVEFIPEKIEFSSNNSIKIAIIGSGIGAVSSAEAIRKRDKTAQIDIYSTEEVLPYHRPLLTKAISNKINQADILIHNKDWYHEHKITLNLNTTITKIDKDNKTIYSKENSYKYDKLILATGAKSFVPPINGVDKNNIFTIRTDKDLIDVKKALEDKKIKDIAVIGGGLLGLETADFIKNLGFNVSVIEAISTILPRQTDSISSQMLFNIIKESGVNLYLDRFVEEITGDDNVTGVITNKGENIPAQLVIISAGIRSNIELAKDIGAKIDRAIVVNEKMETSIQDIYAVGDCAIVNGYFGGLWEPALEQGKVAGANAIGDKLIYTPKVSGATLHAFGTGLFSIGDIGKSDEENRYKVVINRDDLCNKYSAIYFKENKLVGGVLLGDLSKTNLLISGINKNIDIEESIENKIC